MSEEHICEVQQTLTKEDLEELVSFYKPHLRLSDWLIDIDFANNPREVDNCFAQCEFDPLHMAARIKVIKPEHAEFVSGVVGFDAEMSVAHELVHIVLDQIAPDDHGSDVLERTVNTIAEALVTLAHMEESEGSEESEE